jgi:hypothetical protein
MPPEEVQTLLQALQTLLNFGDLDVHVVANHLSTASPVDAESFSTVERRKCKSAGAGAPVDRFTLNQSGAPGIRT